MRKLVCGLAVLLLGLLSVSPANAANAPTRHLDMLYVTLNRVTAESGIQYSEYYSLTPDKGNVYLTVYLSIVNHNDVPLVISPSDFHLLTSDGETIDREYNTVAPGLGQGSDMILSVGGRTHGTITFQLPISSHHSTLQWSPAASSYQLHWPSVVWHLAN